MLLGMLQGSTSGLGLRIHPWLQSSCLLTPPVLVVKPLETKNQEA